jgi:hypothetical protein
VSEWFAEYVPFGHFWHPPPNSMCHPVGHPSFISHLQMKEANERRTKKKEKKIKKNQ